MGPSTMSTETIVLTEVPSDPALPSDSLSPVATAAPKRGLTRRLWSATCGVLRALDTIFGLLSAVVGLAILATIPILQFLSLGYLLECSGRVVRTGRLRDGFIGLSEASRMGSIVLGTWLVLLPIRFLSDIWYSSYLLNGDTGATRGWRLALMVATIAGLFHIAGAWLRGGRLWHFLWPAPLTVYRRIRAGGLWQSAADRLWNFVASLEIPYYFWLGLRGFAGTLIWLLVPISLLILGGHLGEGAGALLSLLGGVLLAYVVVFLSFVQAHYAAERRWSALFDRALVRTWIKQAPIAHWLALLITLTFSIPLYLLKAELVPREAAWLPSILFVVFIYPSRLLAGWAVARGKRAARPGHFIFRWSTRLAAIPIALSYALIVYFTQYISWYGKWSLYEQHAFLLPVPFLEM